MSSRAPADRPLPEERDGMLDAGMESGLQESYDRLDEVLERLTT